MTSSWFFLSTLNYDPPSTTHQIYWYLFYVESILRIICFVLCIRCRSQRPRGLRRESEAARLLKSWVRIPLGAWMSVSCQHCVLSRRGLCDGLITRPEESHRLWCAVKCDLETSIIRRPWSALGRSATGKRK